MNLHLICPQGHPVNVAADRLGSTVACPTCLCTFVAEFDVAMEKNARKDDRRAARDDEDDEDEEDEKPAKKIKPRKAKEDDEEADDKPQKKSKGSKSKSDDDDERVSEKPIKKAKPRSKHDEDDDDEKPRRRKAARRDDDEEDEDDEEPETKAEDDEDEIVWTPRKRQLRMVSTAMIFFRIAYLALLAIFVVDWLMVASLILFVIFLFFGVILAPVVLIATFVAFFVILPAIPLFFVTQTIGWIMCLFAPAKSGARTSAILALVFFFGPVLLYLIYFILIWTEFFRNDQIGERYLVLMHTATGMSGLASFFCGLLALKNVAAFLNERALSNEPVTMGWFIIGGIVLRLACVGIMYIYVLALADFNAAALFGLIFALVFAVLSDSFYLFVIRSTYDLAMATVKIRAVIEAYIQDG